MVADASSAMSALTLSEASSWIRVEAEMARMASLVRDTLDTIRSNAASARLDTSEPWSTRSADSSMRRPICWAASKERSASLRTSPATMENPTPCSPARAASMEALNASRLVWFAISPITRTMSLIEVDERWISEIASIDARSASTPCSALPCVWAARSVAVRDSPAMSAMESASRRTDSVISRVPCSIRRSRCTSSVTS